MSERTSETIMENQLDKYLSFFEHFGLSERAHWTLQGPFYGKTLNLHWNRDKSHSWELIYEGFESEPRALSRSELTDFLEREEVDKDILIKSMNQNIKSLVILSDLLQKHAEDLLGRDHLKEARTQFQKFTDQLSALIKENSRTLTLSHKSPKEPTKEEGKTKGSHLRLIKNSEL